jgi:hypothetical protein
MERRCWRIRDGNPGKGHYEHVSLVPCTFRNVLGRVTCKSFTKRFMEPGARASGSEVGQAGFHMQVMMIAPKHWSVQVMAISFSTSRSCAMQK